MNTPPAWSPTEAAAVYLFLHDLTERLWGDYQQPIIAVIGVPPERQNRSSPAGPAPIDQFRPDDAIPF
jgi:hypothetical protein